MFCLHIGCFSSADHAVAGVLKSHFMFPFKSLSTCLSTGLSIAMLYSALFRKYWHFIIRCESVLKNIKRASCILQCTAVVQ